MEQFKVIGKQTLDYTNKVGKKVVGINLHVSFTSPNVSGIGVQQVYFSEKSSAYENAVKLPLNSIIEIFYDRFGNPASISEIK